MNDQDFRKRNLTDRGWRRSSTARSNSRRFLEKDRMSIRAIVKDGRHRAG